jgi:hypothetical protein
MSKALSGSSANHLEGGELSPALRAVMQAIREIEYGTVEIVLHQGEVREIRQIRKRRIGPESTASN